MLALLLAASAGVLGAVSMTPPMDGRLPVHGWSGVYVGTDPAELPLFGDWLGCEAPSLLVFLGQKDWRDFRNSANWATNLWRDFDEQAIVWSVPLIPKGTATLSQAGEGWYDDAYRHVARTIAEARGSDPVIYVRTGWEFNGDWMTWSAIGRQDHFVAAFRAFVDAFRSVDDRFRFEWNVNVGGTAMNPADAYPGDEYVDVIGMDFYYHAQWGPSDPAAAWRHMVARPFGLQWLEDFAAQHGKPTAYTEWGVEPDDAGPYIEAAAEWFARHRPLYAHYWNSDSAFAGKLTNRAESATARSFREAFRAGARDCGSG